MHKLAVDPAAEEYWAKYFGAYGKAWVRTIPRRVATALTQRIAALRTSEVQQAVATVVPLCAPVVTADRVLVEGAVVFAGPHRIARRVFSAEFAHDGRLVSLDSVAAPAGV